MRKPIAAILKAFNDFFKDHTPKDVADTLAKGPRIPELKQMMCSVAKEVAEALAKLKCDVNRSSIYRWFAKFIPFAHEFLKQIPIRTGERVAGDEVCISGKGDDEDEENGAKKSAAADVQAEEPDKTPATEDVHAADVQAEEPERKKLYLLSTTDIETRFCLAFDVADHKDGFNATNLLKATMERAGRCLPCSSSMASLRTARRIRRCLQPRIRWTNTVYISVTPASTTKRSTTTSKNGSTGRFADTRAPDRISSPIHTRP